MTREDRLRWIAVCTIQASSALNYLDRSLLSSLTATILREFHLNGENFGYLISAFSLTYALSAPFIGSMVDRLGLTIGVSLIVGGWSAVGAATSFTSSYAGLFGCRAVLGLFEAGGIPAGGKAIAIYLEPKHRAIGSAIGQLGLTLGMMGAPLLTVWLQRSHGWRSTFLVSGLLGFVWIPIWLLVARKAPVLASAAIVENSSHSGMLRDRRFLGLIVANMLSLTVYSLWGHWVPHFLETRYKLEETAALAQYVWIPPIFATVGGLIGGWLVLRQIGAGTPVLESRLRVSFFGAVGAFSVAFTPLMPGPALATAMICFSLASILCLSVNYYSIPLDLFGPRHAAFGISMLTAGFGIMQTFLSPLIGRWADSRGWQPVCTLVCLLPLLSWFILKLSFRRA